MKLFVALFISLLFSAPDLRAESPVYSNPLLQKGWNEMIRDNDQSALNYFAQALIDARRKEDTLSAALAYLNLGIASYGSSSSEGMRYAMAAKNEFSKFVSSQPYVAEEGRGKVLQLIATIKFRTGKADDAAALCREVLFIFKDRKDIFGYRGLAFQLLGKISLKSGLTDSARYYAFKALEEHRINKNLTYLPGALSAAAKVEMASGDYASSRKLLDEGLVVARSTDNRAAIVMCLLGLADLHLRSDKNSTETKSLIVNALQVAEGLNDRSYLLSALESLAGLQLSSGNALSAIATKDRIQAVKDSIVIHEKEKLLAAMEVQFDLQEKENELMMIRQEKQLAKITNYWLAGFLFAILSLAVYFIYSIKRNHRKDQLLLQTKEALILSIEEKNALLERTFKDEMDDKESQLAAMSIHLNEKNKILKEVNEGLSSEGKQMGSGPLSAIINKSLKQEKDWDDFNRQFEVANRNFYSRLRSAFSDITPNELRLCALIRLNLTTKEIAAILNISPDSVKTARYRMRKKLKMSTEENLTNFIMNL